MYTVVEVNQNNQERVRGTNLTREQALELVARLEELYPENRYIIEDR